MGRHGETELRVPAGTAHSCRTHKTMTIAYATVKAKGRVVIPAHLRSKFRIEQGTRIAFLEEKGRLVIQPVTNRFIDSMKGVLATHGLPDWSSKARIVACGEDS